MRRHILKIFMSLNQNWNLKSYDMTQNFNSDSVKSKFLRYAHANFLNWIFSEMRGRKIFFDFKFGFSVKFRVEWYVFILDLYLFCTRSYLYSVQHPRNRYFRANHRSKHYRPHMNTYQSTRNFTLNPNLKSKKIFRPRIFEKIQFEKFA